MPAPSLVSVPLAPLITPPKSVLVPSPAMSDFAPITIDPLLLPESEATVRDDPEMAFIVRVPLTVNAVLEERVPAVLSANVPAFTIVAPV